MTHCTYIVCMECRTGHQLVEEERFGHGTMIGRNTLADFSRRHVWRGHDVRVLPSEVARMVIGEPETFAREPACT